MSVLTSIEPSLYCGTYAKYNNGSIDGKWLKLGDYENPEAFLQACRDLHRDESDPELMFQDFEGMPRELYGESLSLEDLQKLYKWLHLPDDDRDLLDEYLDASGETIDQVDVDDVRERLYCILDDPDAPDYNTAMGWYMFDNGLLGEVPGLIEPYLNLAAIGRDFLMDFHVSSNGYVFEAGA